MNCNHPPLTKKQRAVLGFIAEQSGNVTYADIALWFGWQSNHSAVCHVQALKRKGYLAETKPRSQLFKPGPKVINWVPIEELNWTDNLRPVEPDQQQKAIGQFCRDQGIESSPEPEPCLADTPLTNQKDVYLPTEEEIRRQCRLIQKGWSDSTLMRRMVSKPTVLTVPRTNPIDS